MDLVTQERSLERIAWDHARLAQGLSTRVRSLEDARLEHWRVRAAVDDLATFLVSTVIPYEHSQERRLYGVSSGTTRERGFLGSRVSANSRKRIREHRMLADAANGVVQARTALQAVNFAERAQAVFERHIAREDASITTVDRTIRRVADTQTVSAAAPAGLELAPAEVAAGLAVCLEDEIVAEHEWLARHAIALPQALEQDRGAQLALYERIMAGLSRHASLMILDVYPCAIDLSSGGEGDIARRLATDLRTAERAMLRLEGILRGDSLEHPSDFADLWALVVEISGAHVDEEEALVHRLGQRLPVGQAITLLAELRRGSRTAPTRPHPSTAHSGRIGRAAAFINARVDRIQDVLDNRST